MPFHILSSGPFFKPMLQRSSFFITSNMSLSSSSASNKVVIVLSCTERFFNQQISSGSPAHFCSDVSTKVTDFLTELFFTDSSILIFLFNEGKGPLLKTGLRFVSKSLMVIGLGSLVEVLQALKSFLGHSF